MKLFFLKRRKQLPPEDPYEDIIRVRPSRIIFNINVKQHTHPEIRTYREEEYAVEA